MELAEFFQTSLDALTGFVLEGAGAREQAEVIKQCIGSRSYEKGRVKAEKALQSFPNHFEVVYRCAIFYEMMALDTGDKAGYSKAISLYQRAIGLLDQNGDRSVGLRTLYSSISQCYHCLEEYDKALEILKAHNEAGVYDDQLALLLLKLKRWDEALQVSSESMMENLTRMERSAMVLWNCLSEGQGRHGEAQELQEWMVDLYEGLYTEKASYLHKMNAAMYTGCAILAVKRKDTRQALVYLRRAKDAAELFDADPSYDAQRVRFYHGRPATAHDDFGQTAADGIAQTIARQEEPVRSAVQALWEQVCQEA